MQNSKEFLVAVDIVKCLKRSPSNDELQLLYGLYKQSTVGNINITRPNIFNLKETKKWDGWNAQKGLSKYDAEVKYIIYVNELIQKYGVK